MCGSFAGTFSSRERMHTTGDERLGVGAGSSLHHYAVAGLEDEPSEVDRVARALLGPFRRRTSTNGDRYRPYGHSKWRTQVSILARSAGVASSTFQVATSAADNTHFETPVVLPPASATRLATQCETSQHLPRWSSAQHDAIRRRSPRCTTCFSARCTDTSITGLATGPMRRTLLSNSSYRR